MFWKVFKNSAEVFWGYDDIILKLYIDIAKTGDVTKLVKRGNVSSEKCIEAWETLIKRQEKETGSNNFGAYFSLHKAYLSFCNDHETIRATLMLVWLSNKQTIAKDGELVWVNLIRWEDLVWLKSKGHRVDLSSYKSMIQSIEAGLHKNENLVTKAVSKRKELDRMMAGKEQQGEQQSFEQVMALLNFAWPNPVSDDIKLSTYNEYQKILIARNKAQKAQDDARRNNR